MKKTPALQSVGLADFLGGKVAPEKDPAKTRRLLNELIYAGDWVFVHGNKAEANSVVATAFSVLLAGGYDLNGKISANKARPVLYLDSSNDVVASRQRMRSAIPQDDEWNTKALYENLLLSGPNIDPSTCGFNLSAQEDQDALEAMLRSMGNQPCLILDQLNHWLGDGSYRSFVSWLMNLKEGGVTVFLISSGSKNRSEFAPLERAAQLVISVESSAKKPIIKLARPPSSTRKSFTHSSYELKFPSSESTVPTFAPVAHRKKTEFSTEDIKDMYAQVKAGNATVQALADKHGVAGGTISKSFKSISLPKLPVGRKPKGKPSKPSRPFQKEVQRNAILDMKKSPKAKEQSVAIDADDDEELTPLNKNEAW